MNINKITIRNFKNFGDTNFELDKVNILIGPNNSGKSSILQALWLWNLGFLEAVGQKKKDSGVSIGISKLYGLNIKKVEEIFKNLSLMKSWYDDNDKRKQENIRIEIILSGNYFNKNNSKNENWSVGCEFYFSNTQEAIYCKIQDKDDLDPNLIEYLKNIKMVYSHPMTAIILEELVLDSTSVSRRITEGKNGEIIRNLCFKLFTENPEKWSELCELVKKSFFVDLMEPENKSGILEINYKKIGINKSTKYFNFSSLGRGCTQYILLLLIIFSNENALILLDEPDAHLEILKQQEIYDTISNLATKSNSQLIIATHSEAVMTKAINDNVIGVWSDNTHNIIDFNNRGYFKNILSKYSLDKYYLAERYQHCVYLEGETDWDILLEFASLLGKKDSNPKYLKFVEDAKFSRINVIFCGDDVTSKIVGEFRSIKEVLTNKDKIGLSGIAITDNNENLDKKYNNDNPEILIWQQREIENYLFFEETLLEYAKSLGGNGNLFLSNFEEKMKEAIIKNFSPIELEKWRTGGLQNIKASEYLDKIFNYLVVNYPNYKNEILGKGSKNIKKYYYELVKFVPEHKISIEIKDKIDKIIEVIESSKNNLV